jgi:hypothetical protein
MRAVWRWQEKKRKHEKQNQERMFSLVFKDGKAVPVIMCSFCRKQITEESDCLISWCASDQDRALADAKRCKREASIDAEPTCLDCDDRFSNENDGSCGRSYSMPLGAYLYYLAKGAKIDLIHEGIIAESMGAI